MKDRSGWNLRLMEVLKDKSNLACLAKDARSGSGSSQSQSQSNVTPSAGSTGLDWKQRQSGEREPGEDEIEVAA